MRTLPHSSLVSINHDLTLKLEQIWIMMIIRNNICLFLKKINERQSVKMSVYDNHVYDNTPWFSIQILHQDLLEWYVAANMDIHEHTLVTWKKKT